MTLKYPNHTDEGSTLTAQQRLAKKVFMTCAPPFNYYNLNNLLLYIQLLAVLYIYYFVFLNTS